MYLLSPTHPKSATTLVFAGTGEPFCYNRFGFCYYRCFVHLCYIHLHDIAVFPVVFCYNHVMILLEPKIIFAGTDSYFCYHPPRPKSAPTVFLLEPANNFATTMLFVEFLLHPISMNMRDPRLCLLMQPFCQFLLPQVLMIATFILTRCHIPVFFGQFFIATIMFDFAGTEVNFCYFHSWRRCSTVAMDFFLGTGAAPRKREWSGGELRGRRRARLWRGRGGVSGGSVVGRRVLSHLACGGARWEMRGGQRKKGA